MHWLADQIETHLAGRRAPKIIISDERSKLLDQGGGIRRALPMIGDDPFLICNTDSFWIEGPRSNLARLARAFDPGAMEILPLVAAGPARSALTGRAISAWAMTDGSSRASRATSRPSSIPASASSSRSCSSAKRRRPFRLAPFFHAAAAQGRLYGVRLDGLWVHVGRPESYRGSGTRHRPLDSVSGPLAEPVEFL